MMIVYKKKKKKKEKPSDTRKKLTKHKLNNKSTCVTRLKGPSHITKLEITKHNEKL